MQIRNNQYHNQLYKILLPNKKDVWEEIMQDMQEKPD